MCVSNTCWFQRSVFACRCALLGGPRALPFPIHYTQSRACLLLLCLHLLRPIKASPQFSSLSGLGFGVSSKPSEPDFPLIYSLVLSPRVLAIAGFLVWGDWNITLIAPCRYRASKCPTIATPIRILRLLVVFSVAMQVGSSFVYIFQT